MSGKTETYTGLSEPTFKKRYNGHISTFKHEDANHTTLSKHVWVLKNKNISHTVDWRIIARSQAFNPSNGQCRLCNKEKYFIMFKPEGASLNARSEFYSSCRHKAKHLMGGKTWFVNLKLKFQDFKFGYISCGDLECVIMLSLSLYLMSVQSCTWNWQ